MSDYIRDTRKCTLDTMKPALAGAIREHIEKYDLHDVPGSILACCETTSTKKKKGLFAGKPEVILTGVVLTPKWLVWAAGRENETPGVLSAKLRDIQVQDYEQSDMYKLIQDTGVNISGLRTDATQLGTAFIGFGTSLAAAEFRAALKEARRSEG